MRSAVKSPLDKLFLSSPVYPLEKIIFVTSGIEMFSCNKINIEMSA